MLLATTFKKLRESDKNRSSGWSSDSPTSFFADNSHSIKNWTRCLRPRSHGIIISRGTCPQQQITFSFVLSLIQFSLAVFHPRPHRLSSFFSFSPFRCSATATASLSSDLGFDSKIFSVSRPPLFWAKTVLI